MRSFKPDHTFAKRYDALAKAREAIPSADIAAHIEAARETLLALADKHEYTSNQREWARVTRLRARSDHYVETRAIAFIASRMLEELDKVYDLTPAERKIVEARQEAEGKAFRAAIDAMIRGARSSSKPKQDATLAPGSLGPLP